MQVNIYSRIIQSLAAESFFLPRLTVFSFHISSVLKYLDSAQPRGYIFTTVSYHICVILNGA